MAKIKKSYNFAKGVIEKNDSGKYTITETVKDKLKTYDLSLLLDEMIGINDITLSFGFDDEVPDLIEDEDEV